jgi:hypothetical protein
MRRSTPKQPHEFVPLEGGEVFGQHPLAEPDEWLHPAVRVAENSVSAVDRLLCIELYRAAGDPFGREYRFQRRRDDRGKSAQGPAKLRVGKVPPRESGQASACSCSLSKAMGSLCESSLAGVRQQYLPHHRLAQHKDYIYQINTNIDCSRRTML